MIERFRMNKGRKILFITGAGASQESGIPTFRDSNGYWNSFDPAKIASIQALREYPILVNDFYNERRAILKDVKENDFHKLITSVQNKYGEERVAIITTNVDDLHEKANSQNILHLHGSLNEIVKNIHGDIIVENISYKPVSKNDVIKYQARPNVVLFGEGSYIRNGKPYNAYENMDKTLSSIKQNDLIFIVGCSNIIVNFPWEVFNRCPTASVYIINPNEDEVLIKEHNLIKTSACSSIPQVESIILREIL